MASSVAVSGPGLFKRIRQFLSRKGTRTFILPTSFGYAFAAMNLVLFFLAVGYANNLIYIFVFFLISVAWTGTIVTNRNVEGIEVEKFHPRSFFADECGEVVVTLSNRSNSPAWRIEAYFGKEALESEMDSIPEKSHLDFIVPIIMKTRGLHLLPRLIVKSTFPFSLLKAWKVFKSTPQVLIYPARAGKKEFPPNALSQEEIKNSGVFRDHRLYQNTDSLRRIDWRASARRQELLVKTYEGADKQTLHFSWEQTENIPDVESRLSQLALWIDEAERQGHDYGLRVGKFHSELSRGTSHFHSCLEALALTPRGGPL